MVYVIFTVLVLMGGIEKPENGAKVTTENSTIILFPSGKLNFLPMDILG